MQADLFPLCFSLLDEFDDSNCFYSNPYLEFQFEAAPETDCFISLQHLT